MIKDTHKPLGKPTDEEIQFLLESGYLCRDLGRHQEAVDIFLGIAALLPDNPLPDTSIGGVLLASGRVEEAREQLEKTLRQYPDDPFTLAHLGEVSLCRKEPEQTRTYFQRAAEKDPQGPGGQMARSYLELMREVDKK